MSNKPKCPVFGCTIPRGIPHEHPAGVSAVMRDPAAPLNADERAELERYRAEDERDRRTVFLRHNKNSKPTISLADMHARYAKPGSLRDESIRRSNIYVVPADAPMVTGRKLRDALLEAGQYHAVEALTSASAIIHMAPVAPSPKAYNTDLTAQSVLLMAGQECSPRSEITVGVQQAIDLYGAKDMQRRTLAQSIGTIMSWMLGIPCLLLMCFVIGHQLGWWL